MIETEQRAKPNRDIETLLASGSMLEIEPLFALSQLETYLSDLAALNMGATYSDLGISERRHSNRPAIFQVEDAAKGIYSFASPFQLDWEPETIRPGSVAKIGISGVMRSQSGLSSPGAESTVRYLRAAYAHPNIDAVILEINSGGGESLAGNMIANALSERNKPVVSFAYFAASAAYRVAAQTDEIISAGTEAEFGSIGTMISMDTELINEYRKRYTDLYGQTAPGKNAEFRAAMAGNFAPLQGRVDELTTRFQDKIKQLRPLRGPERMKSETVNGSLWGADDAKQRGLVDMIGNIQTAVQRAYALRTKY
jgi:protease IV